MLIQTLFNGIRIHPDPADLTLNLINKATKGKTKEQTTNVFGDGVPVRPNLTPTPMLMHGMIAYYCIDSVSRMVYSCALGG